VDRSRVLAGDPRAALAVHLDFETASACDLRDAGLDNYAKDPSTHVHCLAYGWGDDPCDLWTPYHHDIDPALAMHIANGGLVYAHNAAFELAVWNNVCVPRYGWPRLLPEQVRCTMAMAYAMGLPGALEDAAPALGIEQRKDMVGKRVMMQLAKPREDGSFWTPATAPDKFETLYAYCRQDVEVERALHHRLMELSDDEQKLWQLDYRINQRGVRVDLAAIGKAMILVDKERERLNRQMLITTGGVVGSCTEVQLLVKWIRNQGVTIDGLAKADVLDALTGELPVGVRRALELRKEAAKSSTAKLLAMAKRAGPDGRVRGIHQYHGAATGRWAGRGIQTQNLPRPRKGTKPHHIDDMIGHFHDGAYIDLMYGPTMDALSDCIRGMLVPDPGRDLIAMDFSAIEARVLAWLAGQESILEIFRTHGKIYEHQAAGIYHVNLADVDDAMRQIGKVAVLALGYGGGVGAFQSMAKVYGVKVPDAEADDIKKAWRDVNPAIVNYWYRLEDAAIRALTEGGVQFAGHRDRPIAFKKSGSFLWCRLPSGRVLCYPYPEIQEIQTPWGEAKEALTYMTVVDDNTRRKGKMLPDPAAKGSWQRISTYGGSLAENVTQAVARDLLAAALVRLEDAGFNTVMHIHDECVVEISTSSDNRTIDAVKALMETLPAWAAGLPVAAEGWRGRRYRKG